MQAAEDDLDGYLKAAEELFSRGVGSVLVTLGGKGSLVCTSGKAEHIPAVKLQPVKASAYEIQTASRAPSVVKEIPSRCC